RSKPPELRQPWAYKPSGRRSTRRRSSIFRKRLLQEARAKMGMRPDEQGPLRDEQIRNELNAQVMPFVREGMENLEKALQIDPEYDDAMAYVSLLYRSKADLEESTEAARRDDSLAKEWLQKALDFKKRKTEQRKDVRTEPRP